MAIEHSGGRVLGLPHGGAFILGFFTVIVAKILAAAVVKFTGFSM